MRSNNARNTCRATPSHEPHVPAACRIRKPLAGRLAAHAITISRHVATSYLVVERWSFSLAVRWFPLIFPELALELRHKVSLFLACDNLRMESRTACRRQCTGQTLLDFPHPMPFKVEHVERGNSPFSPKHVCCFSPASYGQATKHPLACPGPPVYPGGHTVCLVCLVVAP